MNKILSWLPAVVAIQIYLSEASVCGQSAGPVTTPSIFWRDNQWQVWKEGTWVPYRQEVAQSAEPAEPEPTEELASPGEPQPEPQLENDGSLYWLGGYGGSYHPPRRHGDRDHRRRPTHHRRPGGADHGNSRDAGTTGGDHRGIGIGQPTIAIGQTTIGIGQPTIGIGQPTIGIGKPTIGIGQANTSIGQTTIGIGQQGAIAPAQPKPAAPKPSMSGNGARLATKSSGKGSH